MMSGTMLDRIFGRVGEDYDFFDRLQFIQASLLSSFEMDNECNGVFVDAGTREHAAGKPLQATWSLAAAFSLHQ